MLKGNTHTSNTIYKIGMLGGCVMVQYTISKKVQKKTGMKTLLNY